MISVVAFWDFIAFRPGLSATATEWIACLGVKGWDAMRNSVLAGNGVARTTVHQADGRSLKVVPARGGTYRLVCSATGSVEADGLAETAVTSYVINTTALRNMVAKALCIPTDPKPVRDVPRAFPVGDWEAVQGASITVFMMLPPTGHLLTSEISRLLAEHGKGFVLLVPGQPRLSSSLRAQMDRQQAAIIPLREVLSEWLSDGSRFRKHAFILKKRAVWFAASRPLTGKYTTSMRKDKQKTAFLPRQV